MIDLSDRVLLSVLLVVSGVGLLDAFISREWDLLAVFLLQSVLVLVVWARQLARRVPTTLRSDLAHWVEQESQRTGEPAQSIVDRALSWRRIGLQGQGEST